MADHDQADMKFFGCLGLGGLLIGGGLAAVMLCAWLASFIHFPITP